MQGLLLVATVSSRNDLIVPKNQIQLVHQSIQIIHLIKVAGMAMMHKALINNILK